LEVLGLVQAVVCTGRRPIRVIWYHDRR
jgi:hypothetical protein